MVDRDVVLAKIAQIDYALLRMQQTQSRSALSAAEREELLELHLQRAAQAAIDLAAHVIATENYELPDAIGRSFAILAEHQVISDELAERLRRMAGFRNVAVHQYERLQPEIVESIVKTNLADVKEFCNALIERFKIARS